MSALDTYLDAVWARAIDHTSYVVQDWWCPAGTSASNVMSCYYDRAYAYPHAFNTYFAMSQIASLYPDLVSYHQPADSYLMRAYDILHTLYSGHGDPGTGYMGEQTLPEIAAALAAAGHTTEAAFVNNAIKRLYQAFSGSKYPYGSEYSYDNTGEEAVYMAARQNGDASVLAKVNAKTRACRGQEPTWYSYADPVTLNGENWWQFQYTAALAGSCLDDFVRNQSQAPELDERLAYAAKLANLGCINSGQIDSDPANLGTVAWSYQGMKGNVYANSFDPPNSKLHDGWRQMSGEADLGLFGAIRILSADVADDPVFGLTCYGCDLAASSGCLAITPTDGVFKRLNLISQKLSLSLDRDRYDAATVSTQNASLGFVLRNQRIGSPHTTHATIAGLAAGTYALSVGGAPAGTVTVGAGKPAVVPLAVGGDATLTVQLGTPCAVSGGAGGRAGTGGATGGGAAGGGAAGAGSPAGSTGFGGAAGPPGGAAGTAGRPGTGGGNGGPGGGGQAETGSSGGCSCDAAGTPGRGGSVILLVLAFSLWARVRQAPGGRRKRAA